MPELTGSVGAAGLNRSHDVRMAQRRLQAAGYSPGVDDGLCGRRTVGAILKAQQHILARPDGRIDVKGPTWRHLTDAGTRRSPLTGGGRVGSTHPSTASPAQRPHPPVQSTQPHAGPILPPSVQRGRPGIETDIGVTSGNVDYKKRLPLPPRDTINLGLHSPSNAEMRRRFGEPRHSYDTECRPPTNKALIAASERCQVGRTTVTGLRPAVESLRIIMAEIRHQLPDLFPHLGSAGMMCCRNVRGSNRSITNHSWGTAVDITIDGKPEPFGERDVWLGLLLIGPIFNRHGWYWGAGYVRSTDCHHFECGSALLDRFRL